jgi:DNA-binding LytR/AlgR family response regulator
MPLNCLIVDDEAPARSLLSAYLTRTPGLALVAACKHVRAAEAALAAHPVQLIFLDVQMPDMLGTDFARCLPRGLRVVFTTAYPQFALEGFDLHATDYLLKPISYPRFRQAVDKALQLTQAPLPAPPAEICIRIDRHTERIPADAVRYIRSDSEYVVYHTAAKRHMVLGSLQRLAEELPPAFMRVHRSYIVNMQHVQALRSNHLLIGKTTLPIGRSYRQAVEQRFQSSRT